MGRRGPVRQPSTAAVLACSFAAGAIPFSNLAARARAGVDLRDVDNGTVSGTNLFRVAGFGPLAVAGVCDVAKGAVGPLLAGADRPFLGAFAAGAAVAGHNWSPLLAGAGGRGISPAIGALGVRAWPGAALLLGGLAAGRGLHQTGLASFVADAVLVPALAASRGSRAALLGACVVTPMLVKRALGNHPPARRGWRSRTQRVLFDRDERC